MTVLLFSLVPSQPLNALGHLWSRDPARYPRINIAQILDRQITYKIDLTGFLFSPNRSYTPQQVSRLEEAVNRAFVMWNDALDPLNVRFVRKQRHETVEVAVFTFNYEPLLPDQWFGDSVAGANTFLTSKQYTLLPIVFDNTEPFDVLDTLPGIFEATLQQPYLRFVDSDNIDIFTVAVHEIGHELGLAHPSDSFRNGGNYNFLALDTVHVDPTCMQTSDFVAGENIKRRRPILRTEMDSIMTPVRIGAVFTEIPPADLAFVAFAHRYFDADGADALLARAKSRFAETTPFRFANVISEFESQTDSPSDNDVPERAMPINPPVIIIGSLGVTRDDHTVKDRDFFRFGVAPEQVGRQWLFDVDGGGGHVGPSWVDTMLEIHDAAGSVLVAVNDSIDPDPGSLSAVDPLLEWVPEVPGVYFLTIRSEVELPDTASTGDYALKIGIEEIPEPAGRVDPFLDPSVGGCTDVLPPVTLEEPACGVFGLLSILMIVLPLGLVRVRHGRVGCVTLARVGCRRFGGAGRTSGKPDG